ncbi:MAG TPA: GFA family protein [Polyangiaceae bacterium]|nr:GFA family protein [Polyangiaceae bacterium]
MGELKTYQGGCHCGAVRYEATTDLGTVLECNCSHCSRKGFLLTFVSSDHFKLLRGEDALTEYQFNKHVVHHLFCKTCGIQSFSWGVRPDGTKSHMLNVRCLDEVDHASYTVKQVDGKSR